MANCIMKFIEVSSFHGFEQMPFFFFLLSSAFRPLCFLTTYCLRSGLLTCSYNELWAKVIVEWADVFFCTDFILRHQKFDA